MHLKVAFHILLASRPCTPRHQFNTESRPVNKATSSWLTLLFLASCWLMTLAKSCRG